MNKFVGCKFQIDRKAKTAILTQQVMIQSFQDGFNSRRIKRTTPAEVGTVERSKKMKRAEVKKIKPSITLELGVGKMHITR